ncbi:MAG: hypothetical protein QNK35_16780 [Bacteroides sp.]|nr:hypothetical protein [Bacteroides sp.]
MNFVRLLPVIFPFGLLAAHFSRMGLFPLTILCLALPLLLFIKKKWVARGIQVLLVLGAAEWIRAMLGYIEIRKSIGDDWTRLAIILIAVALLTALSGLVFKGKTLKKAYHL